VSEEDVANFVVERAKQDPKVKKILEDVRMFDGLREHAGWRRLYDRVKADRERFLLGIARRLMNGEVVDQLEIAHHRGFYQGALWVLGHPEEAEKNLERAARAAWVMANLEQLAEEESASPYA
jgi:hypothetical protein